MLEIRQETDADIPHIHAVTEAAFHGPGEAKLVDALRAARALTLSAVAVIDGQVVGHLGMSPVTIENGARAKPALALAPVSVAPEFQRQGIGAALIRWSLEECRQAGHSLVIVLGHAAYYPRFGFVSAAAHSIRCPFPVPEEAYMVAELATGTLENSVGTVRYRPEFELV